jgi:hypothetical protein
MSELISARQNIDMRAGQSEQHLDKLNLAKVIEVGNKNKVLELPYFSRQNNFKFYEMHK